MLREELLKRVRQIEIGTRKMVSDVMSGQYRSQFKGAGVQFSEHRLYVPGDDVRHIDWKVSARSRDPLIKKFEEERELRVLILVDISRSNQFGSAEYFKSEVAAEISAMLAYAATQVGDKVGLMLFAGEVEKVIPPKKGQQHILRMIRDLLDAEPTTQGTRVDLALESAERVMKHSGVVFVVSDFMASDFEKPLKRLSRKHDVVAIQIQDDREVDIPDVGNILVVDPETGEEAFVNTGSFRFRKWLEEYQASREGGLQRVFKQARVDLLKISTQSDYPEALVRFFQLRKRRR